MGAGPGEAEPKPVTQVVFPTEVGEAVFALKGPGVVGPIAAGGRYYIVKVEEYLPSTLPAFEEVKDRVAQDAERAKGNGVPEAYLEELRKKAQVRFAEDNPYAYQNPPVAKVNEKEILLSEVLQPVFSNQQTVALVQQGLGSSPSSSSFPRPWRTSLTGSSWWRRPEKAASPSSAPRRRSPRPTSATRPGT